MNQLRPFHSEPLLSHTKESVNEKPGLIAVKSEPNLKKSTSILVEDEADGTCHSYYDLLLAAETLENIVMEGTLLGVTIHSRLSALGKKVTKESKQMNDVVLKLVYGTMKFLPCIDTILVKTQFLVYNTQFLNHLGLVKILLYELLKYHFDYRFYPDIDYKMPEGDQDEEYQSNRIELVKDLESCLKEFNVKLAASFARLRIEKQATGETMKEQVYNILPMHVREKINTNKTNIEEVANHIRNMGLYFVKDSSAIKQEQWNDRIFVDSDFPNLISVPPLLFTDIYSSFLVKDGYLVFQDKASLCLSEYLKQLRLDGTSVLETRSGCGIQTIELSQTVGKTGKVICLENRTGRLESLKSHIETFKLKNVEIIKESFLSIQPKESQFDNVETVIVEAPNSGTSILDKLGYLLQEEEFPNENYTHRDILLLKQQQYKTLKQAFEFLNVKRVIYVTRSIHKEENEQVVEEIKDFIGREWNLQCVLPEFESHRTYDYEIEDCFKSSPSQKFGNGIFIASFEKMDPSTLQYLQERQVSLENVEIVEKTVKKKRKKKLTSHQLLLKKLTLTKYQRASVERLSTRKSFIQEPEPVKQLNSIKNQKEIPTLTINLNQDASLLASQDGVLGEEKEIDLGVFGVSLNKKINLLHSSSSTSKKFEKPKSFMVPNPKPWL